MAKKKGRRPAPRKSAQTRATAVARPAPAAMRPDSGGGVQAARASEPAGTEAGFAGEYRYVLDDLKRIAILAAAMFATLAVLALVIR